MDEFFINLVKGWMTGIRIGLRLLWYGFVILFCVGLVVQFFEWLTCAMHS